MTEIDARAGVLRAGLRLVDSGLIARTWGNVSCRVDDESFVITPSGRAYASLAAEDLVLCRVADASFNGAAAKPSVEKGLHAMLYRERAEVGFVIHTHQKWASAMSATGLLDVGGSPVAAYGNAGTGKLTENVRRALTGAEGSVLMSRHGAVCIGADCDAAFAAAQKLEEQSQRLIIARYMGNSGNKMPESLRQVFDYCAGVSGVSADALKAFSRRESDSFVFCLNGAENRYTRLSGDMPEEARLHWEIYRLRPDAAYIEASCDDAVTSYSLKNAPLNAMLDDFAMMMGASVKCAADVSGIASAIKSKRAAVLITGRGGLSFAATHDDAVAGKLLLEKNAAAALTATLFGEAKPMSALHCAVLRAAYLKSYSKKI
jgi:L-fuculose-phosphate aldolase